jgi:hypothetical protein
MFVFGCAASSHQTAATTPTPGNDDPNRWATRPECEKLVDHTLAVLDLDREHPPKNLYLANEQNPDARRTMVDKCTISLNKATYDCMMAAHDTNYMNQCTTMADVKAPTRR